MKNSIDKTKSLMEVANRVTNVDAFPVLEMQVGQSSVPAMDSGSGTDSVRPADTGMQTPNQGTISQPPQTGLPMVPAIGNEVLEWFLWFWENGGSIDPNNMGPYMSQIYDVISGIVGGQFNQDGLNLILGNWGEMYA